MAAGATSSSSLGAIPGLATTANESIESGLATSPSGAAVLNSLGQTPSSIMSASPSHAASALGLSFVPTGSLSMSTTEPNISVLKPPGFLSHVGPRATVHLLADQEAIEEHWPAINSIVTLLHQQVALLHQDQLKGPGVLLCGASYPATVVDEANRHDSAVPSWFSSGSKLKQVGPLLPKAFLLGARGELIAGGNGDGGRLSWTAGVDLGNDGEAEARDLIDWDSVKKGLQIVDEVSLCDTNPSKLSYKLITAALRNQLASQSLPDREQQQQDIPSKCAIKAGLLPTRPLDLGHYLLFVSSASQANQDSVAPEEVTSLAEHVAERLRGVVTVTLPASQTLLQDGKTHESEQKGMHESAVIKSLQSALSRPHGALSTWNGVGLPLSSLGTFGKAPVVGSKHSLPVSVRKAKISLSGFKVPAADEQARASAKKRGRDDASGPGNDDIGDQKQKMDNSDAVQPMASVASSNAGVFEPQRQPLRTPPFWSGPISWDVQDPSGQGKRSVRVWVSAMFMGGPPRGLASSMSSPMMLPWPASLPLSLLRAIHFPLLQAFASSAAVPLVLLQPRPTPGLSSKQGTDPMPETPEQLAKNEGIYTSLARTLEAKQSAVWLALKHSATAPAAQAATRPDESRSTPGVLVISLPSQPSAGPNQQQGQQLTPPAPPRLLGLVFANGVPWEQIQTPSQQAQTAEQLQQAAAQMKRQKAAPKPMTDASGPLNAPAAETSSVKWNDAALAAGGIDTPAQNSKPSAVYVGVLGQGSGASAVAGGTLPNLGVNMNNLPPRAQQMLTAALQQQQQKQWSAAQQKQPQQSPRQLQSQYSLSQSLPQASTMQIEQSAFADELPQNSSTSNFAAVQSWLAANQQHQQQQQHPSQNQPSFGGGPARSGAQQPNRPATLSSTDFAALVEQLGIQLNGGAINGASRATCVNPALVQNQVAQGASQQPDTNLAAYQTFLRSQAQQQQQQQRIAQHATATVGPQETGPTGGNYQPHNASKFCGQMPIEASLTSGTGTGTALGHSPRAPHGQSTAVSGQPALMPDIDFTKLDVQSLQAMLGIK